ncbi:hypothetical protein GQX73_g5932 [Xylaria multiplex]|uniref:Uncharacterized protein n=1 Tax=Xylaria multiplex TaxID=323545 RepID=A0A7C8MRG0_9PEZI|nr:hypothetical protein GQX73_g5932 [Xylaria multiplex]
MFHLSSTYSSSTDSSSTANDFARPPPGFDLEQAKKEFSTRYGQGLFDPADGVEESVEDEITRKIADLEAAGVAVTGKDKKLIANKIRSLREGAWLENLKLRLVGKDTVPIEYFNRLVAQHENTIVQVTWINIEGGRKLKEKDAQIEGLRNLNSKLSGDDSTPLNNAILQDENNDLKEKLAKCQKHGKKLENRLQGLRDELQSERSKPKGDTNGDSALAECKNRVGDLQKQLDSANQSLETARKTASKHYNNVQSLRQQLIEIRRRERGVKDEAIKLRKEIKDLSDALALTQDLNEVNTLKGRLVKSELERANCKAKVEALEKENRDLKNAATTQGQPSDSEATQRRMEAMQRRIAELRTELAGSNGKLTSLERENQRLKDDAAARADPTDPKQRIGDLLAEVRVRDENIKALEALLDQARDNSPRGGDSDNPQGSVAELQARCAALRAESEMYRERWARGVTNDNPALAQFWGAVENTSQEIKQLYQGIARLGNILGLTDGVLDTPAILEKIITQVSLSTTEDRHTPQLTILSLRNTNLIAQVRIESLLRDLDRAALSRSPDEVRASLRAVDEQEMERRVSTRTQTFRNHRRAILGHIFDAQAEFLALAERSGDRDAIEALVDRFLQPGSLPNIEVTQQNSLFSRSN